MISLASAKFADNSINLTGELTFSSAKAIDQQVLVLFEKGDALSIDLSDVTRCDSAGLALLIGWLRTARATQKRIIFYNIPAQLLAIAHASGVDALLPVANQNKTD